MIPNAAVTEKPAITRSRTRVPVPRRWSRRVKIPSANANISPRNTAAMAPETA